jgi:hypothetical protein
MPIPSVTVSATVRVRGGEPAQVAALAQQVAFTLGTALQQAAPRGEQFLRVVDGGRVR